MSCALACIIVNKFKALADGTATELGSEHAHVNQRDLLLPPVDRFGFGCRENSGYYRSSLHLQAFLQIVVGEERLKAAKQLVIDRHAEP